MELYHKQLNSVAELRREKKRLKVMRHVAEKNAEALKDAQGADDPLSSLAGIAGGLFSAKGTPGVLIELAMPLFRLALKKTEKGILKKLAREVLEGYAKWKAIDYGVTLAMRFIRRQKAKKD